VVMSTLNEPLGSRISWNCGMAMPHYGTVCQELHLTKQYGAHCADSFVDNDVQPQVVGSGDPPLSALATVALCSAHASLFRSHGRIRVLMTSISSVAPIPPCGIGIAALRHPASIGEHPSIVALGPAWPSRTLLHMPGQIGPPDHPCAIIRARGRRR